MNILSGAPVNESVIQVQVRFIMSTIKLQLSWRIWERRDHSQKRGHPITAQAATAGALPSSHYSPLDYNWLATLLTILIILYYSISVSLFLHYYPPSK